MTEKPAMMWTFAISSIALFMVTLDNLVVTTALPVIRSDLHASLEGLEWTVNAYTLTFAVLLLTGAALGDRFGRRRIFALGIVIFTAGSAAAALAPTSRCSKVARAVQGVGGAIVHAVDADDPVARPCRPRGAGSRSAPGAASAAWRSRSARSSAARSSQGISWQWIFWLNVPVGLALAAARPDAPAARATARRAGSTCAVSALASVGLFGIVWGLVRGNGQGWASAEIVAAFVAGSSSSRRSSPGSSRADRRCCRCASSATDVRADERGLAVMYFGMFGSIFLLAQFFQTVQGYSPFGSGLRILPWTAMPMFIAPIAGALSDRIGGAGSSASG